MDFIIDNYIIFVGIGLFIVFALIGYIIDSIRKNSTEKTNEPPSNINSFSEINNNMNVVSNQTNNQGDDLLNSYNNTNIQQ